MTAIPMRTGPIAFDLLLWYLYSCCKQKDVVSFYDAKGEPDTMQARAYAEELRTRVAVGMPDWDKYITIEQQVNKITVTSNLIVPKEIINWPWYRARREKMVAATVTAAKPMATLQGNGVAL